MSRTTGECWGTSSPLLGAMHRSPDQLKRSLKRLERVLENESDRRAVTVDLVDQVVLFRQMIISGLHDTQERDRCPAGTEPTVRRTSTG